MAPGYFDGAVPAAESSTDLGFDVVLQRVTLTVDFASKSISGNTEITVQPTTKELRHIRLNCRQARISEARIEGRTAAVTYVDPYEKLKLRGKTDVHQHQNLRSKIEPYVRSNEPEPELTLAIPSRVHVQELQNDAPLARAGFERQDSEFGDKGADTPQTSHGQEPGARFAPLKVFLEFTVDNFRDGLHFVGFEDGDSRYPHLYTRNTIFPGATSSVFPCVDNPNTRCMWEISIRCPKTLGDAFRKPAPSGAFSLGHDGDVAMTGTEQGHGSQKEHYLINLSEEERTLDLSVIASADLTDDIIDPQDLTMRTVSFVQAVPVCARHISFAIGPFEHVDLSEFREMDQDDKLGQNAIHVHGYCLPGRADELRNTCMPMAKAIDDFTVNYGSFPFTNYKLVFVEDLVANVAHTASLSMCSNRLLFPEDIIEPLDSNTRILIHALASQYVGVNIIPKEPVDMWTITGVSGFMTDIFMKKLAGNNEYRFRQKLASEKVFELDYERYSLHQLGSQLDIDPSEYDFLALKSALVLFILDRRLAKASGSAGMSRIISRLILNEKTGDLPNGELSSDWFQKLCEKLGHQRLEAFFKQWVYGAGCPIFNVTQRFNKKKLVVEMIITQKQMDRKTKPKLETTNFMREIKEQVSEAWAPGIQPVFTGPMTIRIHEADGTPYEHIVEIKDAITRIEIPYNTKYKRLKRSKRAKERALANTGDASGEVENDVLLYCLGDVLQSEDEVRDWQLTDWSKEDEDRMGQESYEWIRMDADFEWIGKIQLIMPVYMYVSQLQQDRDVVAQYESLQYVASQNPHPLMSTILIRTLMDRRYFHGIRTLAAAGLARCAIQHLGYIGQYHLEKAFQDFFCMPDSPMPRANDFSDRTTYIIQCAIPKAMARIRDNNGRVPMSVRRFFVDKLKFNDNSNNEFSDSFYVSTLMTCLADALVASVIHPDSAMTADGYDDDDLLEEMARDEAFKKEAVNELERYRRIDEWIASYQNIYSVTAMTCMQKLQQAGVIPNQFKQIAQYTQPANADEVRLKAFTCLVDLKAFRSMPSMLNYLLCSIRDDPSPFFRDRLTRVLGQALGSIAIKDDEEEKPPPKPVEAGGLILEQEAPVEVQPAETVGMSPAELALIALKDAFKDHAIFKQALWNVIQSPNIAVPEVILFLDLAALLYEPSTGLFVRLRYPRTWAFKEWDERDVPLTQKTKVMVLKETSKVRTTPVTGLGMDLWQLTEQYKLKYTGQLSKEVLNHIRDTKAQEKEVKAQIAAMQAQINRPQPQLPAPKSSTAMSPPPLPTPTAERPAAKISLKRKQSIASDSGGRAASPKRQQFSPPAEILAIPPKSSAPKAQAPKISTPKISASKVPAPKSQRSPSVSKTKPPTSATTTTAAAAAATPASGIPRPKTKTAKRETRIVVLKLPAELLRGIKSKRPKPTLKVSTEVPKKNSSSVKPGASSSSTSATPLPKSSSTATGLASGGNFFASPEVQSAAAGNTSLGSFRFYSSGDAPASQAGRIKAEESEPASAISPMTQWRDGKKEKIERANGGSGGNGNASGGSGGVPSRASTPKLTISRPGTPGLGAVGRAPTPKLTVHGGSRSGTPANGIIKRSIPPTASNMGSDRNSSTSAGAGAANGNSVSNAGAHSSGNASTGSAASTPANGEPLKKKLKLKLGRKPDNA